MTYIFQLQPSSYKTYKGMAKHKSLKLHTRHQMSLTFPLMGRPRRKLARTLRSASQLTKLMSLTFERNMCQENSWFNDSYLEEDSAKVRENGDAAKEAGCLVLAVNQKRVYLIFLIGHPSGCRGWGAGRLPFFKHNPMNSMVISGWGTGKSHRAVTLA